MILIVDDEAAVRRMVQHVLTASGHQILEASNGSEALARMGDAPVELIILDYNMPVMDGLDFLRILRGEKKSDIPVLMMSGNTDPEVRKACYGLGVFDFIRKPEDADILQARVQTGLKIAELIEYRRKTGIDMQLAAGILEDLRIPPEVSSAHLDIRTFSASYAAVGGDISLVFGREEERFVTAIGDIRGHGLSAALFSILVSVMARRAYRETLSAHKLLTRLNREIAEFMPGSFFTSMFCCLYDAEHELLHYANAGHPSPFLLAAGRLQRLRSLEQPPLGINRSEEFRSQAIAFKPGDRLLMFTDGAEDALEIEAGARVEGDADTPWALFDNLVAQLRAKKDATDDRTLTMILAK